ncbi:hypothetical protein [Brucella cytisi]|uniref:Uncharacterized protein n=1 Tax=Brucella cytisi TaxID=407152 RepID=A0A1J6I6X6_9HYPH|nr:hypothetical protein [Brucella cytisi]OIS93582.1 hypothetical protein BLA27_09690 [Brucella cytisi]
MLKPIILFIISLLWLMPARIFFGYGTGEIIAAYVYPVTGVRDRFGEERELFAELYGIMFVSGFLYPASVALAIFRLIRVIAIGKYDENSIVRYDLD